jgi:alanyl-tRNA synthetase
MEIWNNVFIQYSREFTEKGNQLLADSRAATNADDRKRLQEAALANRTLVPLPAKHVDTGMGLERIIQVLQGKDDNYAIDLFDPFWQKLTDLSGIKYTGKYTKSNEADPEAEAKDAQLRHDIAFRVIADHVRCLTFALTDGAVPSNEGRGYVLRRILRRAVRFGRQQLDLKEPFLHQLVPVVVDAMGAAFPELRANTHRVTDLIKDEEVSFGRTLDRGIERFDYEAFTALSEAVVGKKDSLGHYVRGMGFENGEGTIEFEIGGEIKREPVAYVNAQEHVKLAQRFRATPLLRGDAAFKLHDTYGFPVDLTRIMAEERGMKVDLEGYEKLMEQARELARSGGKGGDNRLYELPPDALAKLGQAGVKPTDDSAKFNVAPIAATVKAIWDGSTLVDELVHGQQYAVILDRTNFYAEMGGQVGDQGHLLGGANFVVKGTRAIGGYVLHVGLVWAGTMKVGQPVEARRENSTSRDGANHTSTHLANWALREVLGGDVQQKGSLVDPEKLRFDFSHNKALATRNSRRSRRSWRSRSRKAAGVRRGGAAGAALKINGLRACSVRSTRRWCGWCRSARRWPSC